MKSEGIIILGIESSCDETAAAVLAPDGTVLATMTNSIPAALTLTNWCAWQLETEVTGGNNAIAMIRHEVGKTDYFAQSYTLTWSQSASVSNTAATATLSSASGGWDLSNATLTSTNSGCTATISSKSAIVSFIDASIAPPTL